MPEQGRGLLPGLHGLRAAAAMMVLLYHLHAIPNLAVPAALPWIATHFGLGVHLFFALSAFALAWANPQMAERPGPYLVKRFFRIAPLYYLVLAAILLRAGWPGPGRLAAEVTFTFNLLPGWHGGLVPAGWTVGAEMLFYLLLPLLMRVRGVAGMAVATILAMLASGAARLLLTAWMPGSDYSLTSLASNLSVFVTALLAFRIFERVRGTPAEGRVAALAAALALGLLALLLSPAAWLADGPGDARVLAFGCAFAAACLWQALRPSWLMRSRPALWLGERSYSIYLSHFLLILALRPAYGWVLDRLGQGGAAFLACAAITLPPLCLAAALGYRFVEVPGMALGRRLLGRRLDGGGRAGLAPAPRVGA
jgi:peptidoglycan/LPS O-acetylase OafA/YrhL